MESDEVVQKTPKRPLEFDEISPGSQQETKKMTSELEQLKNMFENQMTLMKEMAGTIESIQKDVISIKSTNEKFQERLVAVEERVTKTEEEVEVLKNDGKRHVEETKMELEAIESKFHAYDQSLLNNQLIIRNLPGEIKDSRNSMNTAIERIFQALEIDLNENDYEAYAVANSNKNIACIHMKFASTMLKTRVVKKFREMRKRIDDTPFIVEKLIGLPTEHELNGKLITISNKLSQHSTKVLQYARKSTPAPFDFVYDTPDGNLMVRFSGKAHRIDSCEEVDKLVGIAEKAKSKQPPKKSKEHKTPAPVNTRAAATRKNQGGKLGG